jgi:catabolite repression HPr-like protein
LVETKVIVRLKTGLQARPAALFVQTANRFKAEIFIEKDGKRVNAKSIMGVMSLAVGTGVEIIIRAEGQDAEAAVENLAALVSQEYYTTV